MTMTGPAAATARPRWRRWLLATLPWAAAAGLAVLGVALRAPATSDATAAPVGATPEPVVDAPTSPAAAPEAPASTAAALGPRLELAVLGVARTALGTAGLSQSGPSPHSWPLDARVTAVSPSGPDIVIVTVTALVIDRHDDRWGEPVARAVAVPVRLTPPALLGDGWPVPVDPVPLEPLPHQAVTDVDATVVAALEAAGWTVEEVTAVALVAGHHLAVSLRGTPPGRRAAALHTVWLRDDPGGPTVLPVPRMTPTTTPDPTTEETS